MPDNTIGDFKTMQPGGDGARVASLNPGDTLGQYKVVRLLGRGGMGEVYDAAMGLVVVLAVFLFSGVFRRDSGTIAGSLPSGTVAYLSFDDADSILGLLREIGFVELRAEDSATA